MKIKNNYFRQNELINFGVVIKTYADFQLNIRKILKENKNIFINEDRTSAFIFNEMNRVHLQQGRLLSLNEITKIYEDFKTEKLTQERWDIYIKKETTNFESIQTIVKSLLDIDFSDIVFKIVNLGFTRTVIKIPISDLKRFEKIRNQVAHESKLENSYVSDQKNIKNIIKYFNLILNDVEKKIKEIKCRIHL